jgi:hypothetical protein
MIWTFIILSPIISIVQTDHAALTVSASRQLAHTLAASAAVQVASVVHSLQILFT